MCSVSHIFVLPMQFISKYNLYCHKMRKTNKSGSDRMWQTRASKHKLWIICEWMGFFPFTQSSENAWIQNYASFMFAMMEHHIIGIYVCIFDETITDKMTSCGGCQCDILGRLNYRFFLFLFIFGTKPKQSFRYHQQQQQHTHSVNVLIYASTIRVCRDSANAVSPVDHSTNHHHLCCQMCHSHATNTHRWRIR